MTIGAVRNSPVLTRQQTSLLKGISDICCFLHVSMEDKPCVIRSMPTLCPQKSQRITDTAHLFVCNLLKWHIMHNMYRTPCVHTVYMNGSELGGLTSPSLIRFHCAFERGTVVNIARMCICVPPALSLQVSPCWGSSSWRVWGDPGVIRSWHIDGDRGSAGYAPSWLAFTWHSHSHIQLLLLWIDF